MARNLFLGSHFFLLSGAFFNLSIASLNNFILFCTVCNLTSFSTYQLCFLSLHSVGNYWNIFSCLCYEMYVWSLQILILLLPTSGAVYNDIQQKAFTLGAHWGKGKSLRVNEVMTFLLKSSISMKTSKRKGVTVMSLENITLYPIINLK